MPVVIPSNAAKSQFEQRNFDNTSILDQSALDTLVGYPNLFQNVDDLRDFAGAPSSGSVEAGYVKNWGNQGADKPPPGLYFAVQHPVWIDKGDYNVLGIVDDNGSHAIYIKDVKFNDKAPPRMGAIFLAKVVRFAMRRGITKIQMLAAGGRFWPDDYWVGYYAWARYGFDMPFGQSMVDDQGVPVPYTSARELAPFFPCRPLDLSHCLTVQDVLQEKYGKEWWKVCGNGWFMDFDCSASSASVAALEAFCRENNI